MRLQEIWKCKIQQNARDMKKYVKYAKQNASCVICENFPSFIGE